MPTNYEDFERAMNSLEADPGANSPDDGLPESIDAMMEQALTRPRRAARLISQLQARCESMEQNCRKATHAAEEAQKLLEKLITGNATLCRFETLKDGPEGVRAVCRLGGQVRELSIAPSVNPESLANLKPWEYVCVNENVVVAVWRDDPYLYDNALGEVVSFQGYLNGSRKLARVTRPGQAEEVVHVADHLCAEDLAPRSKLVLMRDDPRSAIASLPADHAVSRFEVPTSTIDTKLSDLACIDSIAEKLILEIVKRVLSPEIRAEFNLDPLRGMLLLSYKPGMGKTAFMRAFAAWLAELGEERGFEVVLYLVKPNEFKSMWHGEDSRIVREELFGAIRARRALPRTKPLIQLVVFDEIDSWGRRPEGGEASLSSAQSDALESLLVELDGMVQEHDEEPAAHLLAVGMSNRPDRIDDAVKRPGRMGDEVIEIPDLDLEGAVKVCLIYMRDRQLAWQLNGKLDKNLAHEDVVARFLRPALQAVYPAVLLRYSTDTQRQVDVTAGEMLASVHYRKAMSIAKDRAANRRVRGVGPPAVGFVDVVEGLLDISLSVAAQMEADPQMLIRHLKIKTPVARVDVTPRGELEAHRFFAQDQV